MQFTHYTQKIEIIKKILINGFAWIPNTRGFIKDLLPLHDFSDREPQEFGMISFTELPPIEAERHRKDYGDYGIVVSKKWAISQKIQKVIYIDRKGPIFECLHRLFQYAYDDLKQKSFRREGEISSMSFTNKVRANIAGGYLYSNLLQIYEYIEPIEHSYQNEWRIVHPQPYYGYGKNKEEIIKNVSPPKGWAKFLNVISLDIDDIVGFVCPANKKTIFRNELPEEYKGKAMDIIN